MIKKDESLVGLDALASNEKKIVDIRQGPQFQTWGGTIFAMIFLFFFIMAIAMAVHGEFLASFICLTISIPLFYLVVDIHGILVDTEIHKIKGYKLFLWFKIGRWSKISDFKTIYLMQKNVIIRNSGYSEYASDTYHYYQIKLVNENDKKEIFLAEYRNYYKALKISTHIANATGLELKNFLRKRNR